MSAFLDLGQAAIRIGDLAEATIAFERARQEWPDHPAGWSGGAFVAYRRGGVAEAIDLWRGAIARSPVAAQPLWWWSALGEALAKLEHWEEAGQTFQTMRERWPEDPAGWRGGAFAAGKRGEWQEAADLWNGCLVRSEPESQPAWWWSALAEALSRCQKFDEATTAYGELRRRWPGAIAGWRGDALNCERQGDWPRAALLWRGCINHLIEADVTPAIYGNCLFALVRAGSWDEAAAVRREAIGRWPDDPSAWRSFVRLFVKHSGWRATARAWERLGGRNQVAPPTHERETITLLLRSGRHAEAAARCSALRKADAGGALWFSARIELLRATGDDRAAFAEVERHLDRQPYGQQFTADEIAAIAFDAAVETSRAEVLLVKWFGEAAAHESFPRSYELNTANPDAGVAALPMTATRQPVNDWRSEARKRLRAFLSERIYSNFRSLAQLAVEKATQEQIRRLLAIGETRFPRSRTTIMLRSLLAAKAVSASDPDEAYASFWRLKLPPASLSIADQLRGRPRRRLVCVLTVRDEDELLRRFIAHYTNPH